MNIHFIIHEDFEAPGAYMEWAKEAKHQVSATRLYLGEQLPSSSDDFDMLIVMGGPQSPNTT
ncbi:glutamine amidotransferase, partial [Streptococcus suis]